MGNNLVDTRPSVRQSECMCKVQDWHRFPHSLAHSRLVGTGGLMYRRVIVSCRATCAVPFILRPIKTNLPQL